MPSVYVSPSSQEHNAYVTGGTEEQWMNKIADKVIPLLNYNGITTCRNNITMDLKAIIIDSNAKNCDVHLAIHSNAGGSRGCEVFVYKQSGIVTNSERLGQYVYNEISAITPTSDRGVKDGKASKLGEIINIKATSILIEVDFHDNKDGSIWIQNNIDNLAKEIVKGVCKYFNIKFKDIEVKPVLDKQYRVYGLLGNGLIEDYAITKAKQLKEQGYKEVYYIKPNGERVEVK